MYGLGQQGNFGDVTGSPPSLLSDIPGNYKWNAWASNRGMAQADAQTYFIGNTT